MLMGKQSGPRNFVHYIEVSVIEGCPLRWVPLYSDISPKVSALYFCVCVCMCVPRRVMKGSFGSLPYVSL